MLSLLIALLSFHTSVELSSLSVMGDHIGDWKYTVEAPDMTYSGIMTLSEGEEGYEGKINSDGVTIPLQDVEIDGDELTFSMNVQGFHCKVSGQFEGTSFKGVVSVDGFEMLMVAEKSK